MAIGAKDYSFTPKLLSLLRGGISKEQVLKDISAGVIVGIVALPLAIAFAIASGVSPAQGLITAIVAGLIISALGGSRVQIGGPTGAFIVIVYAIVQEYGINGLTIATFMAGFLLIAMGLARLGSLLKFVPYPLIVGFTSGIAVIIFSSQLKDFFGLPIQTLPPDLVGKWKLYAIHFKFINWYAFAIATATAFISFNFHKVSRKIPGSLVAIVLSTILVYLFELPVNTIATLFGNLPTQFSMPALPDISFETVKALIQPAFAIALLGGIESLLSAVVADGMIGGSHRSNMELVAQGVANCFAAMFGGIPATGAIARTATNIKNGGRTPIAGIVHAVVLCLIMLVFAQYAVHIPMACLAGILVVVAYHMSEWRQFVSLVKGNRLDVLILLVTFFLTVIFDLILAIEVGVVLSSFILMKRVSDSLSIKSATQPDSEPSQESDRLFEEELKDLPKDVVLYEIDGPLFFGATQAFEDAFRRLHEKPKVLIMRMRHVPFVDATGVYRLRQVIKEFRSRNVSVILSGVNSQVKEELEQGGIYDFIERANLSNNIVASIKRAREILGNNRV